MTALFRRLITLVVLSGLIMGGIAVQPVKAAPPITFTVDSFADDVDYVTNTVCSVGAISGGPCTLRAAINEANWNGDYADIIINIPAGNYDLTIPPVSTNDITSGDLNFSRPNPGYQISLVGIDAEPAVIDAQQLDRVFNISADVKVNFENIVIRGGLLSWTGTSEHPDGAGILNYGDLTLNNVVIEDNEAKCGQTSCVTYIAGGGIFNFGTMYIADSTIRNNTSEDASAIFNTGGSGWMFIKNSTISGNRAVNALTMINYAFLHIRNSTISGNTAGPVHISGTANYDELIIESTTFANVGSASTVYNAAAGTVTIEDSILFNIPTSSGCNCYNYGTWTSNGFNVISDDTCPVTGTGDLGSTDPLLGPLGLWGGTTLTMPLLPGSPAINHRTGYCVNIPESPILPPLNLLEDQRYYDRNDGYCDTGAFEGVMDISSVFLPVMFR